MGWLPEATPSGPGAVAAMGAIMAEPGVGVGRTDRACGVEGLGWPSTVADIWAAIPDGLGGNGGTTPPSVRSTIGRFFRVHARSYADLAMGLK